MIRFVDFRTNRQIATTASTSAMPAYGDTVVVRNIPYGVCGRIFNIEIGALGEPSVDIVVEKISGGDQIAVSK